MDFFDSFEVIRQERDEDEISLTTTVLDNLTKVYEDCKDEAREDRTPIPSPGLSTMESTLVDADALMMENSSSTIHASAYSHPPTSSFHNLNDGEEESTTDNDLNTSEVLLQNLHHQTSAATLLRDALLRDRNNILNTKLSSLIPSSRISASAAPTNVNPNKNINLFLTIVITVFLLTSTFFLVQTWLYSQILTTQNQFHANMTHLDRLELHHHVEQRDQLREYLMHNSYETARVSETHLKQCEQELGRILEDGDNCRKIGQDLKKALKSCQEKTSRVEEYRKVLKKLKKENDRLKGVLVIGGVLGVLIGMQRKFFSGSMKTNCV